MHENSDTLKLSDSFKKRCPECERSYDWNLFHCPEDGTKLVIGTVPGGLIQHKYSVISVLGEGGMGVVFKARDEHTGRIVAIKMLKFDRASSANYHRFKREGKLIFDLHHPNIVEVSEFSFDENAEALIIMECLDGVSLSSEIKSAGRLPIDDAIEYCIQICNGVQYAHGQKIIHRDLKPSNVMLIKQSPEFTAVKILDFGIAKSVDKNISDEALTKSGELCGSPPYMSPEQAQGRALDVRSDVYSIGCILYEMLAGVPPLVGDTTFETLLKQINEIPISLAEASGGQTFSDQLEQILKTTLSKSPDDRYQTVADLRNDLLKLQTSRLLAEQTKTTKPKSDILAPRNLKIALAVICLAIVGLVAFSQFFQSPKPSEDRDILSKDLKELRAASRLAEGMDHNSDPQSDTEIELKRRWISTRLDNSIRFSNTPMFVSATPAVLKEIAKHKELTRLALEDDKADDSVLDYIDKLPLGTLQLRQIAMSDSGCEKLAQMLRLEELVLIGVKRPPYHLTKRGLEKLAHLTRLSSLTINDSDFSDDDLSFVAHLKELKALDLTKTGVTDRFLTNLKNLPHLSSLTLNQDLITENGMMTISNLPALESLSLDFPSVTDEGVRHLTKLHLKTLKLQSNKLTDKCLGSLEKMTTLHELGLGGAHQLTQKRVKQLKEKLPLCLIDCSCTH